MSTYFSMFPTFVYNGASAVDITRRVAVRATISADPRAYAPYEVPAGQRADQLADSYYNTNDREWLVWMSIDVIDPYYDWYLSDDDFNAHLLQKYGSLEEAVERIHHWSMNWYDNDAELSPQGWNSLPDQLKKYYEPNFGLGTNILTYSRRADDLYATTNMVVTAEVGNNTFQVGERVQTFDGPTLEGSAEITWANSSHIKLIHVQTSANAGLTVVGVSSGESLAIVSSDYTANVIPIDERVYWEPVTMMAFERDKNESLKNIRLIDHGYSDAVEIETKKLLQANT